MSNETEIHRILKSIRDGINFASLPKFRTTAEPAYRSLLGMLNRENRRPINSRNLYAVGDKVWDITESNPEQGRIFWKYIEDTSCIKKPFSKQDWIDLLNRNVISSQPQEKGNNIRDGLTFETWLRQRPYVEDLIQSSEVFLTSCISHLFPPMPRSKLRRTKLDLLWIYGRKSVLGFKRTRGEADVGASFKFDNPSHTLAGGAVRSFSYAKHSRVDWASGFTEKRMPIKDTRIDHVTVSLFEDDIPDHGDWINVGTRKHYDGIENLTVQLVSMCRGLTDLSVHEMTCLESRENEDLRFAALDTKRTGNIFDGLDEWLKMLDQWHPGQDTGGFGEGRRFLDQCLQDKDIAETCGHPRTFQALIKNIMLSGSAQLHRRTAGQGQFALTKQTHPITITFRFT